MKITTTSNTRFGRYGGQFVPETLMQPLKELAEAYAHLKEDPQFMRELSGLLADYAGRPTPSTMPDPYPGSSLGRST